MLGICGQLEISCPDQLLRACPRPYPLNVRRRKIAGRIEKKIEKKGLTAAVTGRAGINYHLCSRQQRTQNSKWRIRRKTRDWSPSCSADWRKYKTDMTLPLQWRTMKIENARTIENRTYSTSPGQKTVRHTIQPEESLGFTRGNT